MLSTYVGAAKRVSVPACLLNCFPYRQYPKADGKASSQGGHLDIVLAVRHRVSVRRIALRSSILVKPSCIVGSVTRVAIRSMTKTDVKYASIPDNLH